MQKSTRFLLLLILFLPTQGFSQTPGTRSAVEAISVYPADIRAATLETLKYPITLVQLAKIQAKTSAQFKDLLAPLPLETQKKVWKLVRYPRLVEDLAALGQQTSRQIKPLDDAYPKDIREIVAALEKKDFELLTKISQLDKDAGAGFSRSIQGLPASAVAAFRLVGQHSEIFHILSQTLGLGGDVSQVSQKAQRFATKLQQFHPAGTDKPSPSTGPKDNSQAAATLQKAEKSFDRQNDYELNQDPNPKGAAQVNVGYTPYSSVFLPTGWGYSYWFGWPVWDPYPFI